MNKYIPPIGMNYHINKNGVDPVSLSNSLCKIVSFIQSKSPFTNLRQYDDWWQHDGLHFSKDIIGFDDLFSIIETPRNIFENMPGDDWVFVGISPENNSWYLRFYLDWNRNDEYLEGRFDITIPFSMCDDFEDKVISKLNYAINKEDAEIYYKRIILKP